MVRLAKTYFGLDVAEQRLATIQELNVALLVAKESIAEKSALAEGRLNEINGLTNSFKEERKQHCDNALSSITETERLKRNLKSSEEEIHGLRDEILTKRRSTAPIRSTMHPSWPT